jgi:hypothetical protein
MFRKLHPILLINLPCILPLVSGNFGSFLSVLVDGELIGEYTLVRSRDLTGRVNLSTLSGTNKDYGTRCEMTKIHTCTPEYILQSIQ